MIDYTKSALSKGKTKAELKAARDALRRKVDRAENAKVKVRSGGRCEVVVEGPLNVYNGFRCERAATEIHHLIGGGLRAKGESLLEHRKLHCCHRCHSLITGEVGKRLVRVGGVVPMWTDTYRLVK